MNSTLYYCDSPVRDDSLRLEVITGVFGGIALISVILRMITRLRPFKATFGWDDGTILSVAVFKDYFVPVAPSHYLIGGCHGFDCWPIYR